MHDPITAIYNVVKKRITRGATKEHIEEYKLHLLEVWEYNKRIQGAIKLIDYDEIKRQLNITVK